MAQSASVPGIVPNVRTYGDGMHKGFTPSLISTAVATITLFLYTGWFHVLLALIVGSFWSKACLYLLLFLISTVFLPAKPVLWTSFLKLWVFQTWREYFRFSYLFEEVLDQQKHYVFVEFPHGVFPMGPLVAGMLGAKMFPGWQIYGLAASIVYSIPFYRHFMAWVGTLPATKANYRALLKKGSVVVIVGGIAEMYMVHPEKEQVKLLDRKGYVRVAMAEAADGIVPVYHFGNTQILDFWPQSLQGISRKLRAALGLLYGRFGLPLPRPEPLFMVVGKSIPIPSMSRDDPQFESTVNQVNAKVVTAVQKLYDDHKGQYGWQDRPLVIT